MRRQFCCQCLITVATAVGLMAAEGGAAPPLVEAAKNGNTQNLQELFQKKADVNAAEADGSTALLWASYLDDVASAKLLICAGAHANAANDLGATPLWAASQNGSEAMVRLLLEAGANPNAALLSGETPVMVASRSGYPAVVGHLIAKGANVNARGPRGQTALMWAAAQRHPDVVKSLLAHRADLQARTESWNEVMAVPPHGFVGYNRAIPHGNETALMFAARVGDLASAKLLIAAGANVNDADAWGVSATTLAAHSGFTDLVEYLLEKGANPNASAAGFSALDDAIMRRDEKMVAALLAHGADANAPLRTWTPVRRSSHDFFFPPDWVGATPFWLAARMTEPSIMQLLVRHGADPLFVQHGDHVVAVRGGKGDPFQHRVNVTTALMAAAGMGGGEGWLPVPTSQREARCLETAKLAVELGVDVNAADTDGRNALDGARSLGYKRVIEFLEEKGAKSDRPVKREVKEEN